MARERHLAAIWFADLVDFTRLAGEREDEALSLVESFQQAARAAVEEHGGRIVKYTGDGALAEFASTEKAVLAAVALRDGFADLAVDRPLRVGVHLGEVASGEDEDLYGDGVNMAARLQAEAEPGQVLVSEDVWRQLRRREAFAFESLGRRELKGAKEAMMVFAVGGPGVRGAINPGERRRPVRPRLSAPSVAVLPFDNLSPDPGDEYLAFGVTDQIVTTLARLGDLKVVSRSSVMRYRGTDRPIHEIGAELGVHAIVEGSVQRAGSSVRINAQLIDASSDDHLWADSYDREVEDVFEIQTDVAAHVSRALRRAMTPTDRTRVEALKPATPEAYQHYLRGRYFWNRRTAEGIQRAVQSFEEAIEHDPGYALAHAALAQAWIITPSYGSAPARVTLERARVAAERALEIDPGLGEAHTARGAVRYTLDRDWERAEVDFLCGIDCSPGVATAHHWYAIYLTTQGRFEEALSEMEVARTLDPTSLVINAEVGWIHYFAGDFEQAIEEYAAVSRTAPDFPLTHEFLWQAYEQAHRFDLAAREAGRTARAYDWPGVSETELERALRDGFDSDGARGYWSAKRAWAPRMGRRSTATSPLARATIDAELGLRAEALELLRAAVVEHDPFTPFLAVEPGLASLRDEPEFHALLETCGLGSR